MHRIQKNIKLLILSAVVLGWATVVYGFSSGPLPSRTGAPGEVNCTECHRSFPLNSGGGSVSISGLPSSYTPGTRYNLTVTVAQSGKVRWGFQVTALSDDNLLAGTFTVTDASTTQLNTGSVGGKSRTYVNHTTVGTQRGTQNQASFKFDWTAPATSVGNITFYVAGNAANGDGTDSGDNIYTTSVKVPAGSTASPPTVSALNPTKGPTDGGTSVTITGTNFANGITTTFDGLNAQTTFVDNKTLRVTTPAHGPGVVDVVVKNSNGLSATAKSAFTYEAASLPAPVLADITPKSGPTAGGTDVTLTGSNFIQGATVFFGAREATVSSISATQIKAKTQASDAGTVDVVVKNPDGQQGILKGAFTYEGGTPGVSVQVLTPNGGEVLSSGGLPFTITWKVTSSSSATQQIDLSTDGGLSFNTTVATGVAAGVTSFVYAVPAGISTEKARLRIKVTDGSSTATDVSDSDFKILAAATITSLSPSTTSANSQIAKLKVTGSGFQSGATVEVNGTGVGTKFKSATSLLAKKVNISGAGTYKVRVRNPDGTISAEKDLTAQ